jgi:hypothetical protein
MNGTGSGRGNLHLQGMPDVRASVNFARTARNGCPTAQRPLPLQARDGLFRGVVAAHAVDPGSWWR